MNCPPPPPPPVPGLNNNNSNNVVMSDDYVSGPQRKSLQQVMMEVSSRERAMLGNLTLEQQDDQNYFAWSKNQSYNPKAVIELENIDTVMPNQYLPDAPIPVSTNKNNNNMINSIPLSGSLPMAEPVCYNDKEQAKVVNMENCPIYSPFGISINPIVPSVENKGLSDQAEIKVVNYKPNDVTIQKDDGKTIMIVKGVRIEISGNHSINLNN